MLSLTIGENGIIKKATQSGVAYEEAKAREKLELVLLDMQAEKRTNSEYNKEEYLTKKIEEQGMTVNEDIVIVDGWKFSIDRDIPQIGESLGKESTNEKIKLQLSQTISSDYVKSIVKVEIEYEGEITSIKIAGENIEPIPEKKDGKYIIEKEIEENGLVSVLVKDKEEKYQIGSIKVSEITEDMEIWTKEDLELFRDRVNSGRTYEKRTVRVMADVDLKGSEENKWVPIGKIEEKVNYYFSGNLEGNNHTISNLYINTTSSYQGLFGYTKGDIKNIRLEQVDIEGNTELGSIAGRNEGTITKCYVKGILKGRKGRIGGVVGINFGGNISQCVNDVKIIAEAMLVDNGQYGGIVGGLNGGIVELCYNLGDINITSGSNVGGIAGWVR